MDTRSKMDALRATIASIEADLDTPYTGRPVLEASVASELRASAAELRECAARETSDDGLLADIRAMLDDYQRYVQRIR